MGEQDKTDWRLQGQERYLSGVQLLRQSYGGSQTGPSGEHEHCEFCFPKFMVENVPDALHEGYCTLDGDRWICANCFADFRERFHWELVDRERA